MAVVVSSSMTFFNKFVLPALWAGFFVWAAVMLYTGKVQGDSGPESRWLALAALAFATVPFWGTEASVKRVILEDGFLRISNYATEITVPFSEVRGASIERTRRNRQKLTYMILEFRNPTAFGTSIRFQPASDEEIELVQARLRPEIGPMRDPEAETAAPEARGRGMV